MEWTALISPIISALIAVFGAYQAVRRTADERERKYADSIARLETKMDLLADRVEKHNNVVERTYRLEMEVNNLYNRYAEMRDDYKSMKDGGAE